MRQFKFYIPHTLPTINDIIAWNKKIVPWLSKGKKRVYQYTIKKNEIEGSIINYIYKNSSNNYMDIVCFKKCKIHFKWIEYNKRRDPANVCAGGRKFILDALVKGGFLENDNWNVKHFTDEFKVNRRQSGVEITITEIT